MKRPLLFLLACAALAAFSQLWTRPQAGHCALDGVRIEPIYAVHVEVDGEELGRFCSIVCARTFLQRQGELEGRELQILVHDENTGTPISAERAFYVRSPVVTVEAVDNDVHVFADWAAALLHLETFDGDAVQNPFREWLLREPAR